MRKFDCPAISKFLFFRGQDMQQKANLGKAQGQASGGVPIRGGLQGIEFPAFRGFRCFAKMKNSSFEFGHLSRKKPKGD